MWSVTQAFLVALLNWAIDLGTVSPSHGPLYAAWMGLYTNGSPNVSQQTQLSQMIEPTYPGYARQEVVWYPVYQSNAGPVTLEGGSMYFAPTGTGVQVGISGCFLCTVPTGYNGTLMMGQPFAAPINLSTPLTVVKLLPNFQLGYGLNYGGCYLES